MICHRAEHKAAMSPLEGKVQSKMHGVGGNGADEPTQTPVSPHNGQKQVSGVETDLIRRAEPSHSEQISLGPLLMHSDHGGLHQGGFYRADPAQPPPNPSGSFLPQSTAAIGY